MLIKNSRESSIVADEERARVFAWDTEKSVIGWCAVVEFSRSGSRSYPGFR